MLIGHIYKRQIHYFHIRTDPYWIDKLPVDNWVAYTIADHEDEDLVMKAIPICLDKQVTYTCSAGSLAGFTHISFDIENVKRKFEEAEKDEMEIDNDSVFMTTFDEDISEEFWFAATVAYHPTIVTDTMICLDFTTTGHKAHLIELIRKINAGWLPPDDEIKESAHNTRRLKMSTCNMD
ncbi:MAG: hypothetical protein M3R25_06820 [Bacteroidota bacterium]|nr:hypothetical protein [Bacteroidota bacterium]